MPTQSKATAFSVIPRALQLRGLSAFSLEDRRLNREGFEAAAAGVGSKLTFLGVLYSLGSWLASSEAGVIAGILLGAIGLLANVYYKRQENLRQRARDAREQAEHEARMQRFRIASVPQSV